MLALLVVSGALLHVTSPTGQPMYFVKESIAAVGPAVACDPVAKSMIYTGGGGNFCILEAPEEVARRLEAIQR